MLVKVESKGKDEVLVVSSRQIAEDFEKLHKNILRDIETLKEQIQPAQNWAGYFIPSEYRDAKGIFFARYGVYRRKGPFMEVEIHRGIQ